MSTEAATGEIKARRSHSVPRMLESVAVYLFIAWGALFCLLPLMKLSLGWRMRHDTPFLFYMGYMMDRWGYVPYRDFFDVNMLGSYLINHGVGHFFGFTDRGVHQGDLFFVCLVMCFTVLMLWRLGLKAALAAAVLAALTYLTAGTQMTLQRDFLTLTPATFAVACAAGLPRLGTHWRAWLAGIGFGLAASIKPHAGIGLLAVVLYLAEDHLAEAPGWRLRLQSIFWHTFQAGLGVLLPVLAYAGYLAYHGALGAFVDSALHYVPLYADMNGQHDVLRGAAKRAYTISHTIRLDNRWPLIAASLVGLGCAFANLRGDAAARRIVGMLSLMVPIYGLYPAITGQFWSYHYLPFIYWLSVTAALVFCRQLPLAPWPRRYLPVVLLLLVLASVFKADADFAPLKVQGKEPPKGGRVDAVAQFLNQNLRPGDTVQPLDWVGGGMLHAMLYADARPATRFVTYFDFFHHVDLPYIQNLRKEFMAQLEQAKPRFLIEWTHPGRNIVGKGPGNTNSFPEAEAWIRLHYTKVKSGKEYNIYERRDSAPSAAAAGAQP